MYSSIIAVLVGLAGVSTAFSPDPTPFNITDLDLVSVYGRNTNVDFIVGRERDDFVPFECRGSFTTSAGGPGKKVFRCDNARFKWQFGQYTSLQNFSIALIQTVFSPTENRDIEIGYRTGNIRPPAITCKPCSRGRRCEQPDGTFIFATFG